MDSAVARGENANSGDQWKIFGLDRRFKLGVPQGSVLGPTIFLMLINDLEDGAQSRVLKFADDTKLYTEVTKEEGGEQLQEDLDKCTEWAKQWMMEFNVAKCKVLHAGRTNRMKERFLRKCRSNTWEWWYTKQWMEADRLLRQWRKQTKL